VGPDFPGISSLPVFLSLTLASPFTSCTRGEHAVPDNEIPAADNCVGMARVELGQCLNLGSADRLVNSISPQIRTNRIGQFGIGRSASLAAAFVVKKNI
jgi:hypothetical protein